MLACNVVISEHLPSCFGNNILIAKIVKFLSTQLVHLSGSRLEVVSSFFLSLSHHPQHLPVRRVVLHLQHTGIPHTNCTIIRTCISSVHIKYALTFNLLSGSSTFFLAAILTFFWL